MEEVRRGRRRARSGGGNKWKVLKRRLVCCGGSWSFRGSSPGDWMPEEEGTEGSAAVAEILRTEGAEDGGIPACEGEIREPASSSSAAAEMNLAAALAAERQFRAASAQSQRRLDQARVEEEEEEEEEGERGGAPVRASLVRLMAEGGGADPSEPATEAAEAWWCCVCMGRRRGAAFIPCGHTLCRVCSREVWLNRGACPLCNRRILDVLDIF